MPDEPRLKEKTGSSCNGQSGYYIVWDRVRWAKITGLALGFLISVFIHENQFLKSRADAVEQSASSPPPTAPTTASDNPAILQKKFQKVIMESLTRQRIPFSQFTWLAPKSIDSDIQALPFSIVVGTQKIVLPVYIINHRYLVTTPLLDITRNYAVVPNIPPPQPVALFIPSSVFPLAQFPSFGPSNAPHSLLEFGDEQCPTCRKWNREVQPQIIADKTIRFTYIPYPLTTIHKNALDAAIFEMCVYQEKPDAFWTIHNQIDQRVDLKNIDKEALKPIFAGFMVKAGISTTKVQRCMEQSQPLPLISKTGDSLTERIGVPSTPTFIIDGHVKSGYLSYDDIKQSFSEGSKPLPNGSK
jgi:protein-disulfide isomerase